MPAGMIGSVGVSIGLPVRSAFLPALPIHERNYTLSGITQTISGLILPSCTVKVFNAATDVLVATATSNSITGAYSFTLDKTQGYYLVCYKVGPPDVYGTTVSPLSAT